MGTFAADRSNAFGWAELNAHGLENDIPFYESIFGWTHSTTEGGADAPDYIQFETGGQQIAGAFEMGKEIPAEVPSFWMIYFNVDDVDATAQAAVDAGATLTVPPSDYFAGRFAIIRDPQGATFGIARGDEVG
jgi:predicted enzyme related to lactoylglutathione lyase